MYYERIAGSHRRYPFRRTYFEHVAHTTQREACWAPARLLSRTVDLWSRWFMLLMRRSSPSVVVVAEASALAAHSSACTEASSLFCEFQCHTGLGGGRGGRQCKGSDHEARFEYVTNGGG